MRKKKLKHVYGPVSSWRLGRSLGIDLVSAAGAKTCSFDCIYCQAGKTAILTGERKVFVPTRKIIEEIKAFPRLKIDYITFSGRAEPTLAKNLGEAIKEIKKIKREKIAVLTNSSTIYKKDVQKDLLSADFVIAKLDAPNRALFRKLDKPAKGVTFDNVLRGLKEFRPRYKGKFALQLMFVRENKPFAEEMACLAKSIMPDEIELNTPLRPCGVKPLSKKELAKIERFFKGVNYRSVYKTGGKHDI